MHLHETLFFFLYVKYTLFRRKNGFPLKAMSHLAMRVECGRLVFFLRRKEESGRLLRTALSARLK